MEKKKRTMVAMDGNEAAAHIAYGFTEVAAIYPITPSSPMAEKTDEWSSQGRKNMFGQPVKLVEMQSEAGAIGAIHGALETGSLATTFTSSQGLMLMIPVMYRIAGTKQPAVIHVASRTVGTHAMSIFGDHSDVMACRGTGFAMLSSGSVQEVMDLAAVAHLAAVKARVPVMHFFDGFRTSHEIHKIELLEQDEVTALMDMEALKRFRDEALNPEHPTLRNTVQNPDVYFQIREANNRFYDAVPEVVEHYLNEINRLTGRSYGLFNYYGHPEAERVIVAMGSVSGTVMDTVDYLNARGEKTGYLQVHLYRPFSAEHFLKALPGTVRKIAVLDRCKEHGSVGEPLYADVCAVFSNRPQPPVIVGGRYGLSSKDTDAAQIKAVFDHLKQEAPRTNFTIGIVDDVTHLSLPVGEPIFTEPEGTVSCKFWGLGSDGTVGANKNSIKIISEYTDMHAQAYFEYDTKKSFGITRSHLRFGKRPIRTTSLVKQADFVACHNPYFLDKYDIVTELKPGGVFLLNCPWDESSLTERLPAHMRRVIAERNIALYIIDANRFAQELGLGNHANMILQSAFFSIANIIPPEKAVEYMKDAARKTFGKKGGEVVDKNLAAIDCGMANLIRVRVPEFWKEASPVAPKADDSHLPPVIRDLCNPINALKGDALPVSAFVGYEDGTMPMGTTAYEKRGFATELPVWNKEACLQCNLCAFVCSHSVIRPYLLDGEEAANAPVGFEYCQAKGVADFQYSLQVSSMDCTGCAACVNVCPARGRALRMVPRQAVAADLSHWAYALGLKDKGDVFDPATVKGSQFRQPLVEFSGACAGCGETPYAKLLTQLFGDRVYWANATGCSQAWGAGMPSVAYTTNKCGRGPAWSNSLFEDNAEFALGMALSVGQQRQQMRLLAEKLKEALPPERGDIRSAIEDWEANFNSTAHSRAFSDRLIAALEGAGLTGDAGALAQRILERRDHLAKKTIWMYGGDGWAYDIGFGGLDHVFSMGVDVNVLIVDTEAYANTGGQASKATPLGAAAQFQSSGKPTGKKDIGRQLMTYGNVYVAQVAMGANPNQLIKALVEADSHPGPSLVIAYAPCVTHGIRRGMGSIQEEMKQAVAAGYWHLYRYNPLDSKPFKLDSPEPKGDFKAFLEGEVRYSQLKLTFPEKAEELFNQADAQARQKYQSYKAMEENP